MAGASEEEVLLDIGQLLMGNGRRKSRCGRNLNLERFASRANRFGLQPGFAIDFNYTL